MGFVRHRDADGAWDGRRAPRLRLRAPSGRCSSVATTARPRWSCGTSRSRSAALDPRTPSRTNTRSWCYTASAEVRLGQDWTTDAGPGDIVFVAADEVHQLRTLGDEPLGFLCTALANRAGPAPSGLKRLAPAAKTPAGATAEDDLSRFSGTANSGPTARAGPLDAARRRRNPHRRGLTTSRSGGLAGEAVRPRLGHGTNAVCLTRQRPEPRRLRAPPLRLQAFDAQCPTPRERERLVRDLSAPGSQTLSAKCNDFVKRLAGRPSAPVFILERVSDAHSR